MLLSLVFPNTEDIEHKTYLSFGTIFFALFGSQTWDLYISTLMWWQDERPYKNQSLFLPIAVTLNIMLYFTNIDYWKSW